MTDEETFLLLEDLIYEAMENRMATEEGVLSYVKGRLRDQYHATTDTAVHVVYHHVMEDLFTGADPTVH